MAALPLRVSEAWVQRAVEWAARRVLFTVNRAGMNSRQLSEKVDDATMGEIASAAVAQYLEDVRGQAVRAYDDVRADAYREPDPGWDLVIGPDLTSWPSVADDPREPPRGSHTFSVKSSRIPERYRDNLEAALQGCDFKIFKRSAQIEDDLPADFETQVYYKLASSRYGSCYLVGFASRDAIIAKSRALAASGHSVTWQSRHAGSMKQMWLAPLAIARFPNGDERRSVR